MLGCAKLCVDPSLVATAKLDPGIVSEPTGSTGSAGFLCDPIVILIVLFYFEIP